VKRESFVRSKLRQSFNAFFCVFSAKNQGIAIAKNSASTTLHNDQQGPSNTRFNVETTSINGFHTTKNELDIAMLQILDPHLRPVPPVPNEPTSQKIYNQHMSLAQEYFKVRAKYLDVVSIRKTFISLIRTKRRSHI
jgi:hypothetical protein